MRGTSDRRIFAVRPLEGGPDFSLIRGLRDRAVRDDHGLFLAEGTRNLVSAMDRGVEFAALVTSPSLFVGNLAFVLTNKLRKAGVPIWSLPAESFCPLCQTGDAQGVIAVLRQRWQPLPEPVSAQDLWLGVESIRTYGNLGTLLRSADAVGANGLMVFASATTPDPYDPACVRAAMGSLFTHRIVRTSHRDFRRWSRRWETTVVGATGEADVDYRSVTYRRPTILMLGDEREGLSEGQRNTCDLFVKIPMVGSPDSLNVAMAGTVLLYEAFGQRHPVRRGK